MKEKNLRKSGADHKSNNRYNTMPNFKIKTRAIVIKNMVLV